MTVLALFALALTALAGACRASTEAPGTATGAEASEVSEHGAGLGPPVRGSEPSEPGPGSTAAGPGTSPSELSGGREPPSEAAGGHVVSVTTREDLGVEVLEVSSGDPTLADQFFIRDIGSRDATYLPTAPNFVRLLEIVSRDEVRFLASGRNAADSKREFPFVLDVVRQGGEFVARPERLAIPLDEPVQVGSDRPEALVEVSLDKDSLTLTFGPQAGHEQEFNADGRDVPLIETRLTAGSEDSRSFIIDMPGVVLGEELSPGALPVPDGALFSSVEVRSGPEGTEVVVGATSRMKAFSGELSPPDAESPQATFTFTDEVPGT
ncbi:MAG: hypothetical protein IRZ11_03710 [Clostridia bacterium]|nr:hypothetical protein [Clostridia bacterium]